MVEGGVHFADDLERRLGAFTTDEDDDEDEDDEVYATPEEIAAWGARLNEVL